MNNWYNEIQYLKGKSIGDIEEFIKDVQQVMTNKDSIIKKCLNNLQEYYIVKTDTFIQEIIVGLIWDDISNQLDPFIRGDNYKKIETLCDEMGLNKKNVNIIGSHPGIIRENFNKLLES